MVCVASIRSTILSSGLVIKSHKLKKYKQNVIFAEKVFIENSGECSYLWFHGYQYTKKTVSGNWVWWVCRKRKLMRCPAAMLLITDNQFRSLLRNILIKTINRFTNIKYGVFLQYLVRHKCPQPQIIPLGHPSAGHHAVLSTFVMRIVTTTFGFYFPFGR